MKETLYLSPSFNEFRLFFNDRVKNLRPNLMIRDYEWYHKKENDFFLIRFDEKSAMYGSVSLKTGGIQDLSLIHYKDGSSSARLEFILGCLTMIESLGLKLSIQEKSHLLEELGIVRMRNGRRSKKYSYALANLRFRFFETVKSGFYALLIQFN